MAVQTYSLKRDRNLKLAPHFQVWEFACPGTDVVLVDDRLPPLLEKLRAYLNCSRIVVTSGYRTEAYNKAIGGSKTSYHMKGMAADINCWYRVNGKEQRYHGSVICCALEELGAVGIGWIGGRAVHVDCRPNRYWFDETKNCRSIQSLGCTSFYDYFAQLGFPVDKPVIPGDVDQDGKVTVSDARLALQAAVGKIDAADIHPAAADLNGDGKVDMSDARQILQKAVGKIS